MSVNHYLLPISSEELSGLIDRPEKMHEFVKTRRTDVRTLGTDGVAIVALTAENNRDPLAFLQFGAPQKLSGWVGEYVESDGRVITCQVDMGYGPASYYKNRFLMEVARKLRRLTLEVLEINCDLEWLASHHVYPSGWEEEGRQESLINSFDVYRSCVIYAAESGQNLLVWCA